MVYHFTYSFQTEMGSMTQTNALNTIIPHTHTHGNWLNDATSARILPNQLRWNFVDFIPHAKCECWDQIVVWHVNLIIWSTVDSILYTIPHNSSGNNKNRHTKHMYRKHCQFITQKPKLTTKAHKNDLLFRHYMYVYIYSSRRRRNIYLGLLFTKPHQLCYAS